MLDVVVFGEGSVDRSPCGTGISALLAMLRTKNTVQENEDIVIKSVFGGMFTVASHAERNEDDQLFIVPKITGNAYIIGESKHFFNDDDPLIYGFHL